MKHLFYNTGSIIGFILKKDKIKILIWIIALIAYAVGFVPVFQGILDTSSNPQVLVDTMKNPAMIAMVGPVFVEDSYTIGSIYANYMMVFSALIAGAMNIFIVSSNTRKDEELGRTELLRALPVGRLSNLSASLTIAFFANLILLLATAIGMYFISPDIYLKGAIIFSAGIYGYGFLFACIVSLLGEIFTNNRAVMGAGFFLLFLSYILRAVGDVSMEALSLVSPLGLVTRTENFVNDYIWPFWILLLEIILVALLSFFFAKNRDLGSGLIPERKGKSSASVFLSGIKTFAFRINRSGFLIWALVIFIFSGMYGSVFGDLENYINSSDLLKNMFNVQGVHSLTEQFISLLMVIMAIITTIPSLAFLHRIISEEHKGLSEEILTKPVSRYEYLFSFFIISICTAFILQVLVALGFWSVGRIYLENIPTLEIFIKAALLYVPAIWLMIGVSTFLIGITPRFAWLNYIFLCYNFVIVYLGDMLDFPDILGDLTPFGNVVSYPLEEITWGASILMTVLFILLSAAGFIGYRKRDLMN